MHRKSQQNLDKLFELVKNIDGITALYNINIEDTKIQHNILSKSHNQESFVQYIKKIFPIFKEDKFEILLVDLEERIICKKVDNTNIIVCVSDKKVPLGKILTLLKSIDF